MFTCGEWSASLPAKAGSQNCILEVDDIIKPWTWSCKFDLVHIRRSHGSFTKKQWNLPYKEIYK